MPGGGRGPNLWDVADEEEAFDHAARVLYAAAPDDFLTTRRELVETLRGDGEAAVAQAVGKLRKPTVAAWIVNAHVLADDDAFARISDLGDRLRTAQDALDAPKLRALSQERRSTVAALTDDALSRAGRTAPSTTVQDEVRSTFDAAVADPGIASRLGRLQRAESFSGFGFGDGSPPQLTLVRGGRTDPPAKGKQPAGRTASKSAARTTAAKAPSRRGAAERPKADPARERAIEKARDEVERAEAEVSTARDAEKEMVGQLGAAERALAEAKDAVAAAKAARERSRDEHRKALARRREARRALDRARQGR